MPACGVTTGSRGYRRYKRVPIDSVFFLGRLVGEAWSWRELVMGLLRDSVVVVVGICVVTSTVRDHEDALAASPRIGSGAG